MVSPTTKRQKLHNLIDNGLEGPMRHYKTCEKNWIANGQDDESHETIWLCYFLGTL